MPIDDFGSSWIGIIANPAGYLLKRKSMSKSVDEHKGGHPINQVLTGLESELSFKEKRKNWVNKCVADVRSQDVGKSDGNTTRACEGAFDSDPFAQQVLNGIQFREDTRISSTEKSNRIRNTVMFVLVVVITIILILLLVKKYRTS